MKRDHSLLFSQIDYKPFRVYESGGQRCEFYNLESYKNYEVYMEDLYTHFEENNKYLKVLIHPEYYEASKALFEDRMIPFLFEYWPLFNLYSQRRSMSKLFTFVPIVFVLLYLITNFFVFSIVGILTAVLSFILSTRVKAIAKKINHYRERMIKVMTVAKNDELKSNLDAYYQRKSQKLEELSAAKEREVEINRNIKSRIESDLKEKESTELEKSDFELDPKDYE